MILTDRHSDKMTMRILNEADSLGLYIQRDDGDDTGSSLGVTLDDREQELLLREWLAIRLDQQGSYDLARRLRHAPDDLGLMEMVLMFVRGPVPQ